MGNWANFNAVKARSIFKFVQLKYIESLFKKTTIAFKYIFMPQFQSTYF